MSFIEIVNAVTKTPAHKLGVHKGELKEGYDADIVLFDENFGIMMTIIAGKIKYKKV